MKMLSQEEVEQRIKKFNEYMEKEKELQEELLFLDISGHRDRVIEKQNRHDEIIEEIEKLRMGKMMPILDEIGAFVAYCQKVESGEIKLGDPWPPAEEAAPEEKDSETTQEQ